MRRQAAQYDVGRKVDNIAVLRSFIPFIWPADRPDLRVRVMLAFVAMVIAKVVTVAVPVAYKAAVDGLTGQSASGDSVSSIESTTLVFIPVVLILIYGAGRTAMVAFNQIRDSLFVSVSQYAVRELSNQTFKHLHKLSLRFHLERRTGGLSRVIERGVNAIELITRMGVMNSVPTIIELILICGMLLFYFGIEFVFIIFATVVAYIWFTFVASEWRLKIRRDMNDSDTDANSKAIDSLLNFETVKYFGNEMMESERFDRSRAKYEVAAVRTYYSLGVLNTGQTFIFSIGLTACMILSAYGVANGTQTVGDFVMVNALLIQLYQPLFFMGMVYREIKQGLVDMENMFDLLGKHPEVVDIPGAKPLQVPQGDVEFKNVSFAYDANRPILKDISFKVPAGKMVALVGPSGAGKSTISRILFRFYEVAGGQVIIDGQDISKVQQKSLRAAIGMVPQDTVLFNDSIYYNILYGRPDASREEVVAAAKLAQIDEFVVGLPDGYETMVGERGLKLSGGEKQRVAIARTILKAPPILMLDEATSALDSHTEKEIQDALDRVSQDRTTLVIAHRLSTIVHADEIIVMEAGQIVERGDHASLIETDGLYASMWARQREAEEARERLALVEQDPMAVKQKTDLTPE